jgi:muramoyltetrapeptide carboxypeptidase
LYKQGFFAKITARVGAPQTSIGKTIHRIEEGCLLDPTTMLLKSRSPVHKPARLQRGARIGVVAPAGSVEPESLEAGIAAIRAEGFEVELSHGIFERKGYLAGDAKERANDLLDYFRRSDIDAIFCARGGFGSIQVLPYLSVELKKYPKIFVGYSDITVLLNWLRQFCGMVTFHAPMVAMDFARGLSEQSRAYLWRVLSGETRTWKLDLEETIRPGRAESELMGGCLSILVTTLGTPYEVDTRGKLLFLEDIGEQPYRVERMLTHLKMAGKLDKVAGVLFGDFTNCDGDGPRDVKQVIKDLFVDAPYPVVMGMKAGHAEENLTLPFGAKMLLDGNAAIMQLLESPVI